MGSDNGSIKIDSKSGISIPIALFLFALAELIGGIWWGATLTERTNNLRDLVREEKARIESESKARDLTIQQEIDVEELKRERLERELFKKGILRDLPKEKEGEG